MSLLIYRGEGRTVKTSIKEKDDCGNLGAMDLSDVVELQYEFASKEENRRLIWRLHDVAFLATQVNVSANKISFPGHGYSQDKKLRFGTTGTLPAGLLPATDYFVILVNADEFQLSLTSGGSALTLTSATGSGTHEILGGDLAVISPAQLGEVNWTYRPADTNDMVVGDGASVPFVLKKTGADPRIGTGQVVDVRDK